MEIISLKFLAFLAVALCGYYLIPRRQQNLWLLIASSIYFATWNWLHLVILVFFTLANYAVGRRLAGQAKNTSSLLYVGIAFNIAFLAFLKYVNFFIPESSTISGLNALDFLFPLGLSYMVLETISYLVDIYHGRINPESNLLDFTLYLLYFPKLLAGPIARASNFLPNLKHPKRLDFKDFAQGFALILLGAFRKLVLADSLFAIMPSALFASPSSFGGGELLMWLIAYAFAIYNDFAGYTNFVRGISRCFGIHLQANFALPYFASSFAEFWERWHITLSHWLRDYIYFPFSRWLAKKIPNRRHILNLSLPPVVTMAVSALWHGAAWHYLFWGLLHGLFLAVERLRAAFWRRPRAFSSLPAWRKAAAGLLVFTLSMLAWLPFNLPLPIAAEYANSLFGGFTLPVVDPRWIVLILLALGLDGLQSRFENELFFRSWSRQAKAGLIAFALLAIFVSTQGDSQAPFIYQGF